MNELRLVNFGKAYGDNVIFENLNYTFNPGVYAFMGESGSGKSTLMKCIAGLEKYTGEICLNGIQLKGTTPEVHMVHQHYYSFPWHNLVKNVLMVYVGHEVKITEEAREEARSILTRFGLGDHFSKIPSQISGGMDQRLSLCSAFVNPWSKVVLYDEPSSGLDLGNTKILAELIAEHQQKYGTIEIISTHDERLLGLLNPTVIEFTEAFKTGKGLNKETENVNAH